MIKKTETKKDAGKKKSTAKKTKKPQEIKKTENVIEQVVNNEEEPKETLEEKEPITVDLTDIMEFETEEGGVDEPEENVNILDDEEEVDAEPQNKEEDVDNGAGEADEDVEQKDDFLDEQKDDFLEEEPKEEENRQNEQDTEVSEEKETINERSISGAKEEFVTEDSGNEIETDNIVNKQANKTVEEKKPKKKNKIIQYLTYLWNGVEID